jgi:hypothetical protein
MKLVDHKFKILGARLIWVLRNYANKSSLSLFGQIFLLFFFCLKISLYYGNNSSKIVASTRDLIIIEVSGTTLEHNRERVRILYSMKSNLIVIIIKDLKLSV